MGYLFNPRANLAIASACSFAALSLACGVGSVQAAEGSVGTILEEVEVTARKRARGEKLQEVPVAATAYSGDQLEALQTRDLESLAFKMPNVQLDDVGTVKGTANFTIRGLGVNSSIPSIDPTVGVFVDGMYLGINGGVIFDMFDLEGIEVLRGPQGLLFGRNVTGGAVVVKTAKPTEEFSSKFKLSTTDHRKTIAAASVNGQISDSVNGRLTAYHSNDPGWFENKYTGNDSYGDNSMWFVRPSATFELGDSTELVVRLEHGEGESDGTVAINRGNDFLVAGGEFYPSATQIAESVGVTDWDNSRDSFEVAQDEEGWGEREWSHAITEFNHDVAFGNGTITNILAWREYFSDGFADIDSLPIHGFHSGSSVDQSQVSNELRYAGRFGATSITTGLYWFSQDLTYFEHRSLQGGAIDWTGSGVQDHEARGVFAQADIDLSDAWVLTLGGRYSTEEKDAKIATIPLNLCVKNEGCAAYDFEDGETWSAFTPKVGLQWNLGEDAQVYGFWTKGFRSGGYNMRNTGINPETGAPYLPGPTDQEEQSSFELGAKASFMGGRVRTNFALFHNTIEDMQREENRSDAISGVVQLIRNTADATIQGAEFEMTAGLSDSLLLSMNAGYVDGSYDEIWSDISGDGVVNDIDKSLEIPRLAPWTYGLGLVHDLELGAAGTLTSRINYNHRDAAPYTDDNRGMLNEAEMVDFSIGFAPLDGNYRLSLYGKNMLDEVVEGNDTQLPLTLGGVGATFTPLKAGRVMGLDFTYEL